MNAGLSIFLITVGAILRYALDWQPTAVDLRALGLILMLAGGATMVVSMLRAAGSPTELGRGRDIVGMTRPLWHVPPWSRRRRPQSTPVSFPTPPATSHLTTSHSAAPHPCSSPCSSRPASQPLSTDPPAWISADGQAGFETPLWPYEETPYEGTWRDEASWREDEAWYGEEAWSGQARGWAANDRAGPRDERIRLAEEPWPSERLWPEERAHPDQRAGPDGESWSDGPSRADAQGGRDRPGWRIPR